MSDTEQKLDRIKELLEELVSIQKDVQTRQAKFHGLYKRVLWVGAGFLVIYFALNLFLL